MLVRMRNGNIENLFDSVARHFISLGRATALQPTKEEAILHTEAQGGPAACIGVEYAVCEPNSERAVLRFVRTARSRG